MARHYIRNGVLGWPIEEQEKAISGAVKIDPEASYRDILPPDKAKHPARIKPEWLLQRAELLRPTGRRGGETIAVATLLALAINEADLVSVIVQAAARGASLLATDSGFGLACDLATPEGIQLAVQDWQRAKASARTKPGRTAGYIAAAEKKRADTKAKIKLARPFWKDTQPNRLSIQEIAEKVGLSTKTLHRELHSRPRRRQST